MTDWWIVGKSAKHRPNIIAWRKCPVSVSPQHNSNEQERIDYQLHLYTIRAKTTLTNTPNEFRISCLLKTLRCCLHWHHSAIFSQDEKNIYLKDKCKVRFNCCNCPLRLWAAVQARAVTSPGLELRCAGSSGSHQFSWSGSPAKSSRLQSTMEPFASCG